MSDQFKIPKPFPGELYEHHWQRTLQAFEDHANARLKALLDQLSAHHVGSSNIGNVGTIGVEAP